MENIGTPMNVLADGNCLFNAVSLILYGTEFYAMHLRVLTCIKMCKNEAWYVRRYNVDDLLLLSPSYEDACFDCGTKDAWSCSWTIIALADVIGQNIVTSYPPIYGKSKVPEGFFTK